MSRTPAAGPARRNLALAVCAAAAIAVNGVGLALADRSSALEVPTARQVTRLRGMPLLIVPMRPSTTTGETLRHGPGAAALTIAAATSARPPVEAWRESSTSTSAAEPVRFYRLSEVDSPAEPAGDWALDLDTLDALGLDRVAFEVLVSDRGDIVSCILLDTVGLLPEMRASLESRLRSTDMRPATRGGMRVASVRHVELYVASGAEPLSSGPS